jgi:HSP20 family molecular chaperone IbpA
MRMTAWPHTGDTGPMIASKPHETGDMLVITCRVPCTDLSQLSLALDGHQVVVTVPDGFRHELALPAEADMSRLGVELYRGILELRAPHAGPSRTTSLVA